MLRGACLAAVWPKAERKDKLADVVPSCATESAVDKILLKHSVNVFNQHTYIPYNTCWMFYGAIKREDLLQTMPLFPEYIYI